MQRPFGRGPTTLVRGLAITIVINHSLHGMIFYEEILDTPFRSKSLPSNPFRIPDTSGSLES